MGEGAHRPESSFSKYVGRLLGEVLRNDAVAGQFDFLAEDMWEDNPIPTPEIP